ncbi:type I phosphodiesterase/nucleotide pyrophosphatase [Paenibacillus larvae subsp. larvae DSM 25430]|nr:type I phosphodiesterase/nucleotide pyrophosphatase [Paenibacillus larvae subsp. larvae DSM 25430]
MAPFIFWNLAFYTIIRTQLATNVTPLEKCDSTHMKNGSLMNNIRLPGKIGGCEWIIITIISYGPETQIHSANNIRSTAFGDILLLPCPE